MTLENLVLEQLKRDGYWFDIGQLHKETLKALARLIRKGKVKKEIKLWPWITSGIIKKTFYQAI